MLRQLSLSEQLVPTFRSAYESFPFSWVYLTTVDEAMIIYPYLPLEQAVNNGTLTETAYYKAAGFDERAVGWTPPYLDLVGAGLMITASYPIYAGDTLLGVSSRDITLKELARSVLSHLTGATGSSALLIDGEGLAIDATDATLAAEIDRVNSEAGAAVLYFRSAEGVRRLGTKDAVASQSAEVSFAVGRLLRQAESSSAPTVRLDIDGRRVPSASPWPGPSPRGCCAAASARPASTTRARSRTGWPCAGSPSPSRRGCWCRYLSRRWPCRCSAPCSGSPWRRW